MFTITVIGLPEVIKFTNKFPTQFRTNRKGAHDRIAANGVKTFQNEAHVRTGKMKKGIVKGKITEDQSEIIAQVPYSGYENKRGKPHAFFTTGIKKITEDAKKEEMNAAKSALNVR
ncbi:MAG TPA: hypothetical protein VL854_04265 [Nitrososphaeraceae archaeon]|nr:hypothetical protein [Nitrososphaeraceae archaeon]